jgi:hypothetical protein
MHPRLIERRPPDSRGETLSRWELADGATALVLSNGPESHTVYVGLTPWPRGLLWEPKRVMPLLRGCSARQIWCVDGWGVVFTGYAVEEVVGRMREVVLEGQEYWGVDSPAEPSAAPDPAGL